MRVNTIYKMRFHIAGATTVFIVILVIALCRDTGFPPNLIKPTREYHEFMQAKYIAHTFNDFAARENRLPVDENEFLLFSMHPDKASKWMRCKIINRKWPILPDEPYLILIGPEGGGFIGYGDGRLEKL